MKKNSPRARPATAKRSATPKTVEEYLADVPESARGMLNRVRALIKETANRAVAPAEVMEVICYGIPAFRIETPKYKGMLMWYAAFSDHCSLFPTASVIKAFKEELKGYRVSKGTIQFGISGSGKDKPLPVALLKKMVNARLAEMADKQTDGKKRRG